MTVSEYIEKLNTRYKTGISTEHTFRGDLQNLLESLVPGIIATNEPKRIACGAPDYIITKRNIPVGYIEAKDIGADLHDKSYKEQFDRYKKSLPNLIITDYLNFQLFHDGLYITSVSIGEIQAKKIVPNNSSFSSFTDLIADFCTRITQSIKSASRLSIMMAGKARLLENIIESALTSDENNKEDSSLKDQLNAFKDILIHDITPKAFADIYAQTIAYGMFAARLNDPTLEDFSRQEASELIPKSNPFLRKLFGYIAGPDIDDRIRWIVDALVEIFRATNVAEILQDFGKATQQHDPMIHFYETFLAEYDSKLRKMRGVYYTPEPVVNFIVRAIDDILKNEFSVVNGLADTSKVKIKVKDVSKATHDLRSKTKTIEREEEVHKVQILDPAAGTGTFLAEVVKLIYNKFEGQEGIWSNYVENHLIPRLNGFEILMASYAMAHLKLDLLLRETGYRSTSEQRFRVYLTNSLEEYHPDTGTLFANWLSTEANEANHVKRDTPVMVVLGNPPYSGISTNKGKWITKLIDDYKYIDGEYFGEKKHWLQDDYVKFIRFGEYLIEKNGEGILAFINNHSFLDNPTFRGMRWKLLNSFNSIYIIDLHGNAKKKELCPDGSEDKNIFDIQAGVSINLFIRTKTKGKEKLAKVNHVDLWGNRESKYQKLFNSNLNSLLFSIVTPEKPYYFFLPKENSGQEDFEKGFFISDLFSKSTVGFVSANDEMNISFSKDDQIEKINDLVQIDEAIWRIKYNRDKDARDWTYNTAKNDALNNSNEKNYLRVAYRPFDSRWTCYTGNSRGLYSSPQIKIMKHFLGESNFGLIIGRQGQVVGSMPWNLCFITKQITDFNLYYRGGGMTFPLYILPEKTDQTSIDGTSQRTPNLNLEILKIFAEKIGLKFISEKLDRNETFAPIDVLDYIYAVLHSPTYREKYKEFLKIDFPRIPYPENAGNFWRLVKLGSELRQIHLLESPIVNNYITTYPVNGSNGVVKLRYEDEKVWVNLDQYFDHVPQVAWEFYIGGYQPAQKWLKDRKGRILSYDDIMHYQKIIVALNETDRIMKEIDKIDFME